MRIEQTAEGFRAGHWLNVDGSWIWAGSSNGQPAERPNQKRSLSNLLAECSMSYCDDDSLSPERRAVINETLNGLGWE